MEEQSRTNSGTNIKSMNEHEMRGARKGEETLKLASSVNVVNKDHGLMFFAQINNSMIVHFQSLSRYSIIIVHFLVDSALLGKGYKDLICHELCL